MENISANAEDIEREVTDRILNVYIYRLVLV